MDIASLISIGGGIIVIVFGIISSGASIITYIDYPSLIITLGGAFVSSLGCFKMPEFVNGLKGAALIFKEPPIPSAEEIIKCFGAYL